MVVETFFRDISRRGLKAEARPSRDDGPRSATRRRTVTMTERGTPKGNDPTAARPILPGRLNGRRGSNTELTRRYPRCRYVCCQSDRSPDGPVSVPRRRARSPTGRLDGAGRPACGFQGGRARLPETL